jgi:hypothetical protein
MVSVNEDNCDYLFRFLINYEVAKSSEVKVKNFLGLDAEKLEDF